MMVCLDDKFDLFQIKFEEMNGAYDADTLRMTSGDAFFWMTSRERP